MADVFDSEKPDDWEDTPQLVTDSILLLPHGKQRSRPYAMDCEMCLTEDGKGLTRVPIIDYESDIVVYDTLVKPPTPVDYLTNLLHRLISSLTHLPPPCRWSGITEASLATATATLTLLVPPSGPTAILASHGSPRNSTIARHNPEEDGHACVDLFRIKVKTWRRNGGQGSARAAVVDHGNPGVMRGAKARCRVCERGPIIFRVDAESNGGYAGCGGLADRDIVRTLAAAQGALNVHLVALYTSLPARTAVIFTGHSDLRRTASLNTRKVAFESAIKI
ncbi:hypothetical protein OG21DRAFT_1603312 [Imleria badia]|nr:hypothetical protein OG21DRAFT_1603312 [Imleria badia]